MNVVFIYQFLNIQSPQI